MRNIVFIGLLLLSGCAGWPYGGDRQPGGMDCGGKKPTRGNCGLSHNATPQEGGSCGSDYDCSLGQFCRKAGYSYNGVCVNKN